MKPLSNPRRAARRVDAPDAHALGAADPDRVIQALVEAHRPVAQGLGVVGGQPLHVLHRQPGPLEREHDAGEVKRRGVGEHVALGEGAGLGFAVTETGDAVVEHAPARLHQPRQLPGVVVDLHVADVLDHPDAGHGVERLSRQLAVVLDPNVHAVGEPGLGGAPAAELGLRLGQGYAGHVHAALARSVNGEAAPAAADVEHALPGLECELVAHQGELGLLGLLERGRPAREQRTAVGHRVVEEQREVVVRQVVVVAHRAGVAQQAVAPALRLELGRRDAGRPDHAHRAGGRQRQPRLGAAVDRRRLPAAQNVEQPVDVVHVERARDVGAAQAQLPGGAQHVGERRRRAHGEGGPAAAIGRGQPAAVPQLYGEGTLRQRPLHFLDERFGSRRHRPRP